MIIKTTTLDKRLFCEVSLFCYGREEYFDIVGNIDVDIILSLFIELITYS